MVEQLYQVAGSYQTIVQQILLLEPIQGLS